MPSGGLVGTTLKLDYWNERWRTGTLLPTERKESRDNNDGVITAMESDAFKVA